MAVMTLAAPQAPALSRDTITYADVERLTRRPLVRTFCTVSACGQLVCGMSFISRLRRRLGGDENVDRYAPPGDD